jgi:glycosyltransferase involved in cell wall biosynthesis
MAVKVLMFVSNPFTNDPRVYNEARALVQAGYKVTVIAWDREKQNPPRELQDGIEVIRLRTRLLPKRYSFGSPFWVGFNSLLWQQQAYRRALALNKETPVDVIHCHDFDTLRIGVRLTRKLGIPLVYDAHEIYGYMMVRLFPRWIASIFLRLEKRLIKKADTIITVNEPCKGYFRDVTDKPISIIMNCKQLLTLKYEPVDNKDNFTVIYIGGLAKQRFILELANVVSELPDVNCIIAGMGQPDYVQALREKCTKAPNITFLGKVPFKEVLTLTSKADVILCMFDPDDPNNRVGMPNKLFEAMVCGRPIICTKGTYSGEITEQEEVGLTVEYSKEALKEAIIKLRDNPQLREELGRNALQAAISKYNWQKQEEELLGLYQGIAHQSASS